MKDQVPAFILARSGRMRDGLLALLRAIPQIGTVQQMEHGLTEFKSVPGQDQGLVLLDGSLMNQELWTYLKQAKGRHSGSQYKYIVLADNTMQQRLAQAAGVDGILLAGFPAAQFFTTIERLIDRVEAYPNGRAAEKYSGFFVFPGQIQKSDHHPAASGRPSAGTHY